MRREGRKRFSFFDVCVVAGVAESKFLISSRVRSCDDDRGCGIISSLFVCVCEWTGSSSWWCAHEKQKEEKKPSENEYNFSFLDSFLSEVLHNDVIASALLKIISMIFSFSLVGVRSRARERVSERRQFVVFRRAAATSE